MLDGMMSDELFNSSAPIERIDSALHNKIKIKKVGWKNYRSLYPIELGMLR
jgi:hypothetical protein